ncbi:MAG: hypothetical protein CVV55_07525, partial [Synergistetes bacterium HGW-Synergistetes-2]
YCGGYPWESRSPPEILFKEHRKPSRVNPPDGFLRICISSCTLGSAEYERSGDFYDEEPPSEDLFPPGRLFVFGDVRRDVRALIFPELLRFCESAFQRLTILLSSNKITLNTSQKRTKHA